MADPALPAVEEAAANGAVVEGEAVTEGELEQPQAQDAEAQESDPFAPVAPQPVATGPVLPAAKLHTDDAAGVFSINITKDAQLVEVLRMIGQMSQRNIVPSRGVTGTLPAMDLFDVTVYEALNGLLHGAGYVYREDGSFIYVYTPQELANVEKSTRRMVTEVFPLHYTPATEAQALIKDLVSSDGRIAITSPAQRGIQFTATDAGGDSLAKGSILVVTDYPENIDRIRTIMQEVDRRPQQVLVEATILRASLTEDNALGVDFTMLGGVDFRTLTQAGVQPPRQALTGVVADGGITDQGYYGGSTGFTDAVPAGGLRMGLVYNNIAVFLSALEQVTDTSVMANPKVLVLNRQKGEVKVVRKDAYRGKVTIDPSGVRTQEVEFIETGTKLIFRPFIGNDGYIRLEIHPEDSNVIGSLSPDLPPTQVSTEATTNIIVRDGHTVVIGGLFREVSSSARNQVPILGNLPLAGALFRSKADSTIREEIIILLTPHIVKDDSAYSAASEEQLRHAERLRVGVRKGMMWFGRERLAESAYEKAVREVEHPRGSRRKALWHLNSAINLNPQFTEAVVLRQQLTAREVTSVDNSSIRYFLREQILAEGDAEPTDLQQPIEGLEMAPPLDHPLEQPVLHGADWDLVTADEPQSDETVAEADEPQELTIEEIERMAGIERRDDQADADQAETDQDVALDQNLFEMLEEPTDAEAAGEEGEDASDTAVTEVPLVGLDTEMVVPLTDK